MTSTTYQVTGMTCEHCEAAVKREVGQLNGLLDVEVSLATGRMIVTSQSAPDDAAVIAAVDEAGYQATRLP